MENRYSISKHHRWVNLNGKKFTYLTVLGFLATEKKWECLCDCGKLKITGANHLLSGNTKSCGCNYESLRSILSKKKECEKEKYLTMRINKKLCCIN